MILNIKSEIAIDVVGTVTLEVGTQTLEVETRTQVHLHTQVPVFSKLQIMKWPNADFLAQKCDEVVRERLGGWQPAEPTIKEKKV